MVTDITSYDPLLSCTAYDKEILLKKITIEDWIKIPESDFIQFE